MKNNILKLFGTAFFLCLFLLQPVSATVLVNQLQQHPSAYLAMHGNDPVAWQEWNQQTVKRAQQEGKLLFVSSGYFSCHWCHVMQRESYKNKSVAALLNKHFIPVKVDRELNGALDSKLIDFVEKTQGQAGWPLNIFITPDGYPLVGMTYVPTSNFIAVLKSLHVKWKDERQQLNTLARQATQELGASQAITEVKLTPGMGKEYLMRLLSQSVMMMDEMSGGFGEQNKFPSVPQLHALLDVYVINPAKELKQFLELTLDKMASQGLHDQLSGGFFRYVVDPTWQVPHFEKMLYDNAMLANLYLEAAEKLKRPELARVAIKTLDFLLNTFQNKQGAFIASLSAIDDKGVEGGYYIWRKDELKNILTKDEFKVVELAWQVSDVPDVEDGQHFTWSMPVNEIAAQLKFPLGKTQQLIDTSIEKLLITRSRRKLPQDNKIITSWNGLLLSAFSKAAVYLPGDKNKPYLQAAEKLKTFIYEKLWKNKQLYRAINRGKILAKGELEDYAYFAQGLSDWMAVNQDLKNQFWLKQIIEQAWQRFYTAQGWQLTEHMLLKYAQGQHVIYDGVLPSPAAVLLNVTLQQLKRQPKLLSEQLKINALRALKSGHDKLTAEPFWHATQIKVLHQYQGEL